MIRYRSDAELGLSKDNNVFRALMQRIKSLEMNDAIVEMFTIQVMIGLLLIF